MLQLAHTATHEGIQKTLQHLRADLAIDNNRALVRDFVRAYTVYQHNKTTSLRLARLLQRLEITSQVWADISIDFMEELPKVHGKSVILTVVDRFSMYAHFISLGHPYTTASVAQAFFTTLCASTGSLRPSSATTIPCSWAMSGGTSSSVTASSSG